MIDLKDLRQDPEKYRRGAHAKGIEVDLDALLDVDARLRRATAEHEELAAEKNRIGKEIGRVAGELKKAEGQRKEELEAERERLQQRPSEIKQRQQELEQELQDLRPKRDELLLQTPLPPDPEVPSGTDEEDNVELRRWRPSHFDPERSYQENRGFAPEDHLSLMQRHGMVDLQRGVKIAGSRSYVLCGAGMRLHQAVLRYAFDFMTQEQGFTPVSVPVLVREQMMEGTGFFPHGRGEAYCVNESERGGGQDLYLTGTGEVGLMGYRAAEILSADELPCCYTTVSTCFRREAGAAGRDTAGLFRLHQFEKVEQVVLCRADEQESRRWHERMIQYVEQLLQRLGVPYRLVHCCSGEIGQKNADQVDIECWMPSRGEWAETHSASRLYDYQCRRLNLRYRDPEKGNPVVAHSLNNTVAASPRLLIPLVELMQDEEGGIAVPEALQPYMGGQARIPPPEA